MPQQFRTTTFACLLTALAAAATATPNELNTASAKKYLFEMDIQRLQVTFHGFGNKKFTVYRRSDGPDCGNDNWNGFIANIQRDTSGTVWVTKRKCGQNI